MALFEAFLAIPGIMGGGPNGWIQIYSWSVGASNPTNVGSSGGGTSSGKVSLSDFSIGKLVDQSSPLLFQSILQGAIFPSATLTVKGPASLVTVTFTNVTISGYNLDQNLPTNVTIAGPTPFPCPPDQGSGPKESVSFNFGSLSIDYKPQG